MSKVEQENIDERFPTFKKETYIRADKFFPESLLLHAKDRSKTLESLEKSEEENNKKDTPPPEIIDHHDEEGGGKERYESLMDGIDAEKQLTLPYETAAKELATLAQQMENVPDSEQGIIDQMVNAIMDIYHKSNVKSAKDYKVLADSAGRHSKIGKFYWRKYLELRDKTNDGDEIEREEVESFIKASSLAKDLLELSLQAKKLGSNPDTIEKNSKYIYFPDTEELVKMIDHEAYYLLTIKARALGLIPFEAMDKLRTLKIRVAGASAVTHLLDLLISSGAEDLGWFDNGYVDPSNTGRLSRMCIKLFGKSKALSLQKTFHDLNPFAKLKGTKGKVLDPRISSLGPNDISYEEFIKDADIVIEVIDDVKGKIGLRLHIRDNNGKIKIVYLADVSNPFVGIEDTTKDNHFHQDMPTGFFENISEKFELIADSDKTPEEKQALKGLLSLQSVVAMLIKDFPPEHQVQFLSILAGLVPFWSQTAISARESAAIGTRAILMMLMEIDKVVGKNLTSETIPHSFYTYTDEQLETLRKIMMVIFNLPKMRSSEDKDSSEPAIANDNSDSDNV